MRRALGIRFLILLGVIGVALVGVGVWAFWTAGAPGARAEGRATSLPTGHAPTPASLALHAGDPLSVSWHQTIFPAASPLGGAIGGGYLITRYAESGSTPTLPAGCAALQAGSADPLSCTESALATGHWQYTVTPHFFNWIGAESDRSSVVVVSPNTPTSVALANGLGVGNAYINAANAGTINIDVGVPSTSLATDAIHVTLSDGSNTATGSASAIDGAGTVHVTGINAAGLADGPITISAKATSFQGDDSGSKTGGTTKDTTNPVVSIGQSPAVNGAGWNNSPITFHATGADAGGSGIQSCDSDVLYGGPDTASGSQTMHCTDNAGNVGSAAAGFKYDATKPASSASGNDSNWHHSDVTAHLSAGDSNGSDGSGVATIDYTVDGGPAQTISGAAGDVVIGAPADHSNDGLHTIAFHATDVADNQEAPSHSVTVKIDTTPPVITATATNANTTTYVAGTWTNQDVTVSFGCADTGAVAIQSGLADNSVGGGGTQSAETSTGSFANSGSCTDNAGNTADPVTFGPIMLDKTAPVISATAKNHDHTYTADTWTNQDVTVTFGCAEVGSVQSGIGSNSVGGGTQSAETSAGSFTSGSCTDNAGNSASPVTFGPIKLDRTAPVISATATKADGSSYVAGTWTNEEVTVSFSCADTGAVQSGLAGTGSIGGGGTQSADTSTGSFTSGSCTDNAGNAAAAVTFGPIKLDSVAPVVTLTRENGATVTFPFNTAADITSVGGACGTAADDAATVDVTIDSISAIAPCTSGSWTLTLATPLSAAGNYAVLATQSDAAGNTGTSGSKTITKIGAPG